MIYVVGGLANTGTTMAMKCLVAGGIPLYLPLECNNNLEVNWNKPDRIWTENPDEHCVKCVGPEGYLSLNRNFPGHPVRVIVTCRDVVERRPKKQQTALKRWQKWTETVLNWLQYPQLDKLYVMNYNWCLAEPKVVWERIARLGWPINAKLAAAVPNRDENHHQRMAEW